MLHIPAGSTLYCRATYDNTAENPNNLSSPPVLSSWGEASTDEMLLVRMQYVDYETGDENMVISTSLNETIAAPDVEPDRATFFALAPNPAQAGTQVEWYLNRAVNLHVMLYDLTGRMVRELIPATTWNAGFHRFPLALEETASGLYLVSIEGDGFRLSQRLVLLP